MIKKHIYAEWIFTIYEIELAHLIFILYQKKISSVSDPFYLDLDPDPGATNLTSNRKYQNNFFKIFLSKQKSDPLL